LPWAARGDRLVASISIQKLDAGLHKRLLERGGKSIVSARVQEIWPAKVDNERRRPTSAVAEKVEEASAEKVGR
jgi:hypothetical protein